jgi:hypothetical protein
MDQNKNHLPVLPTNNPPSLNFYTVIGKRDTVTRSLRGNLPVKSNRLEERVDLCYGKVMEILRIFR